MKLDSAKTCLLLIEYQNDFTTEGGALYSGVKAVMQSTNMIANTIDTVDRARKAGVRILFAPISFSPGYREINSAPYGVLKTIVESEAFVRGTWGSQITDELEPQPEDILIEGKRGLDTFASTNLDFILRSLDISNLVIAGFLTNCCVESTARTGYERGFQVVTLSDCTATLSEQEQRFTLEKNLPMFARVLRHKQFLAELSPSAA